MKITRISVWHADLPLAESYRLSGGRLVFEELDTTFVRIDTDAGVSGRGEGCPWGHTYLPAHGPGLRAGLDILGPALIGHDPRALDDINRRLDVTLPGHAYVKSPLDVACWDIFGQVADMPLWLLFGGSEPEAVAVNSSIPTGSSEEMIGHIRSARAKGYKTHSAKIGGTDVRADIERIEAISAALEADETVTFDVNRAWSPATAIRVLNQVSARDWIEQPCETLDQCRKVAQRVSQPILLDECLTGFQDHPDAWRLQACEGLKIKPNRVGGLTRARQIRDLALAVGWQMHIEDTGGSALADTAAIHLASSTPDTHRMASWLCHEHLAVDPVAGAGARNRNGRVHPGNAPGLGVVPVLDLIGDPIAVYGG